MLRLLEIEECFMLIPYNIKKKNDIQQKRIGKRLKSIYSWTIYKYPDQEVLIYAGYHIHCYVFSHPTKPQT